MGIKVTFYTDLDANETAKKDAESTEDKPQSETKKESLLKSKDVAPITEVKKKELKTEKK